MYASIIIMIVVVDWEGEGGWRKVEGEKEVLADEQRM